MYSVSRQWPSSRIASWFDIQLQVTLKQKRSPKKQWNCSETAPKVSSGQGVHPQRDCPLNLADFRSKFVALSDCLDDNRFVDVTVARFLRDYFRTLSVLFPNLLVSWRDIQLPGLSPIATIKDFVACIKTLCLSPLSYTFGNVKKLDVPFVGKPRQYLMKILTRRGPKSVFFGNTILYLKCVADKVPESFIKSELEKHRSRLQRETNPKAEYNPEKEMFNIYILNQFRRDLGRDLHSLKFDPQEDVENVSTKGTIEVSGALGGGYTYYNSYVSNDDHHDLAGNFRPLVTRILANETGAMMSRVRLPLRQFELTSELNRMVSFKRKVCAVTEPLKVRVVTVHHAAESAGFASFQKRSQQILARGPEVTTGQPKFNSVEGPNCDFGDEDILELQTKQQLMRDYYGEPVMLVSDDATAATDSIDPKLSANFAEQFVDPNDPLLPALQNWSGACVSYPDKYEIPNVKQEFAQLMGDRRSFSVLCAIHRSAKRAFLSAYRVPKEFWFVRVNGDDGLIILPKRLIELYFKWMDNLWSLNSLKTYVHSRYFSFNSVLWDSVKGCSVDLIRFKLIDGIDKFGDEIRNPMVWNTVLRSLKSHPDLESKVWSFFASEWHNKLKDISKDGLHNWFAPLACGGLGLIPPKGIDVDYTLVQKTGIKLCFDSIDGQASKGLASRIIASKGSYSFPVQKFTFLDKNLVRTPSGLKEVVDPIVKQLYQDDKTTLRVGKFAVGYPLHFGEVTGMVREIRNLSQDYIPFTQTNQINHAA